MVTSLFSLLGPLLILTHNTYTSVVSVESFLTETRFASSFAGSSNTGSSTPSLTNAQFLEDLVFSNTACNFEKTLLLDYRCIPNDTIPRTGKLVYKNNLGTPEDLKGWIMEGPGKTLFSEGWMDMFSPGKKWDHVLWCPIDFPSSFIAEWEMQNRDTSEGLTIVFFAAKGKNGKDIFDPSLPKRDGTFKYYNRGELNSYHISYYTNNPKNPGREKANLRKDPMFALLQQGEAGIPPGSLNKHKIKLIKNESRIIMYVDDRKIIDCRDTAKTFGDPYFSGKIGFRQMRWSHFRYRNFKVWNIKTDK